MKSIPAKVASVSPRPSRPLRKEPAKSVNPVVSASNQQPSYSSQQPSYLSQSTSVSTRSQPASFNTRVQPTLLNTQSQSISLNTQSQSTSISTRPQSTSVNTPSLAAPLNTPSLTASQPATNASQASFTSSQPFPNPPASPPSSISTGRAAASEPRQGRTASPASSPLLRSFAQTPSIEPVGEPGFGSLEECITAHKVMIWHCITSLQWELKMVNDLPPNETNAESIEHYKEAIRGLMEKRIAEEESFASRLKRFKPWRVC